MTPPAMWYLDHDLEQSCIHLYKNGKRLAHEGGAKNGTLYGAVCKLSLVKNKDDAVLLKFTFTNGKPRGFGFSCFDYQASILSNLFHQKKVSSEKEFITLWNSHVAPSLNERTGKYGITSSLESLPSSSVHTTPETVTPLDRTSSRKRKSVSHTPSRSDQPLARPVKIIKTTHSTPSETPESSDDADIDEEIRKCFVGHYELPVSCLVEPSPCRLLRKIDSKFVDNLKENMLANPSTDSAPIVGLVTLPENETSFDSSRKETYHYETIGGNNSRVAVQSLLIETEDPFYRTRLVSVYQGLSDKQALRLASQHNLVTSFHHQMTTWEKVEICRNLLYQMGGRDRATDEPPEKPRHWRTHCSSILMQPVRKLDDASIYYLAGLSNDLYSLLEKVFRKYGEGKLKGQVARRGSLGKTLDLKGSNFKPLRGIDMSTIKQLFDELVAEKMSLQELARECTRIKQLGAVQLAFVQQTGAKSWSEAEHRFTNFASPQALDEFTTNPKLINSQRFKAFCQQALLSQTGDPTEHSNEVYGRGKSVAIVAIQSAVTATFMNLREIAESGNKFWPFSGFAVTFFDAEDVSEGQSIEMIVRSVRAINTMGGINSFIIAISGGCSMIQPIQGALNSCGIHKQEIVFLYNEDTTSGNERGAIFIQSTRVMVIGVYGDVAGAGRCISNVFSFPASHTLVDDERKPASRPDMPSSCYKKILAVISKPGDWIYFPLIATDSGLIASIEEERNAIGISISPTTVGLLKRRMCRWSSDSSDAHSAEDNSEEL